MVVRFSLEWSVAAALPGVIASMTSKPVIGVPVGGKVPFDLFYQLYKCHRNASATVGVDRGDNGALAVQILATSNDSLAAAYAEYRTAMTAKVISDDESIQG